MPPDEPERRARSARSLRAAVAAAFADLGDRDEVLVAVSGGADSVALLHLAHAVLPALGQRIAVAHLDHRLRPDAADDRLFVADLCTRLEVPMVFAERDVAALAKHRRRGIEEAAREARYEFLDAVAAERGSAAVALGHTLDDRAETLLLNLARGAGAAGLSSMRMRRGRFRRPLLECARAELRAYLREIGADHREDPTNADQGLARNYVRAQVLPALARLNPRVVRSLARTARILADEEDYLARRAAELSGLGETNVTTLTRLPSPLGRRAALALLRNHCGDGAAIGHRHVDALLALAAAGAGGRQLDLPGGWRARRQGDEIAFERTRERPPPQPFARPLVVPGDSDLPELGLRLRATEAGDEPPVAAGAAVHLPLGRTPGMIVRSARAGDRFRPLGGPGSRPLGRYLRDRGLARPDRTRVALLEQAGDILWIVGQQVGEAARIEPGAPMIWVEALPLLAQPADAPRG